MTETPKKRRGRPAKKKKEEVQEAPAFLEEPKPNKQRIGRPRGSKNIERPLITEEKEPCPHCKKTNLIIVKVDPPVNVCHRVQGEVYNTLIRKLCRCKSCGNHMRKNVYEIR